MQDFFGAVDDYFAACLTNILDFVKVNFGAAWTDTVDALYACSNECCGNTVEAGWNSY
jgi:hypothetical protein